MLRFDPSPIIVAGDGATYPLQRIRLKAKGESDYDEAWLQRIIHAHPDCLPVEEIEPGFGDMIPICMELPTKHGFVDNLMMTPEGNIAIVETKLWRNPEARRKVVAQAIDYASCLFEMDYAELEAGVFRANLGNRDKPYSLYEMIKGIDAVVEATFIDAVNRNLRRGRVLVLVVGDGIRTEAERLSGILQSHAGFHFMFALVELPSIVCRLILNFLFTLACFQRRR